MLRLKENGSLFPSEFLFHLDGITISGWALDSKIFINGTEIEPSSAFSFGSSIDQCVFVAKVKGEASVLERPSKSLEATELHSMGNY